MISPEYIQMYLAACGILVLSTCSFLLLAGTVLIASCKYSVHQMSMTEWFSSYAWVVIV